MRAPGITYSFANRKDVSGPTMEVLSTNEFLINNSTSQFIRLADLPKDRALVLTNVSITGEPGLAQFVTQIFLQGRTATELFFEIARLGFAPEVDRIHNLNWEGEVFILGGGDGSVQLSADVLYDAGVATNRMEASFHGIIIPRGNIAPF